MVYILFVLWFVFLLKWADLLVEGASSLAKRFAWSEIIIWLTIVAFGTSLPEFAVNITSSISWNPSLILGNILWSNIANILLVLGVAAMFYPLQLQKNTVFKEIPFSLLGVVILAIALHGGLNWNIELSSLARVEWVVLLVFFVFFMGYVFRITKKKEDLPVEVQIPRYSVKKSILVIVLWLVWLIFWGYWIVNGAVIIATKFGIAQSVIGLTIIAVWTSLPELATSIVAAIKRKTDIAIGNIVWSNIFNIFFVLWASSLIAPIPAYKLVNRDIIVLLVASVILFLFVLIGKKFVVKKYQWRIMVSLYFCYLALVIFKIV